VVYSTQKYRVSGLFPSSGVLGSRNTTFRKLDLFPFSGEGGEDTQLGPLERANLNLIGIFPAFVLKWEKPRKNQNILCLA
jgi:hypothetical protein